MKVGIYTPGLGQSYQDETVEKYAKRFINEYNFNYTGVKFSQLTERITYGNDKQSTVVSIIKEQGAAQEVVYKLYEFNFNSILTDRFNNLNILAKNLKLFWLVVKKFPYLIYRLFRPNTYSHPAQTMYLFFIFFIIAISIMFILPAAVAVINNLVATETFTTLINEVGKKGVEMEVSKAQSLLAKISETFISVTALLLVVVPKAKVIITDLATEFVCANNYLELGEQSQQVQGNLDQLIEYIAEHDADSKIHYHCYSFGTLIMLDLLFPFGTAPSKNIQNLSEAIVTIGSPVEFTKAYFPKYYENRNTVLNNKLVWLNVFSALDSLGSNFRKDNGRGDAQLGLFTGGMKPINLNYEISNVSRHNIWRSLGLGGIKAHGHYWDPAPEGLSCMRIIYNEMDKQKLL